MLPTHKNTLLPSCAMSGHSTLNTPRQTTVGQVSAVLSMLGVGMMLSPELFIDNLICTDCIRKKANQAAVSSKISYISTATMDSFLSSQLQLSRCASLPLSAIISRLYPGVQDCCTSGDVGTCWPILTLSVLLHSSSTLPFQISLFLGVVYLFHSTV